MYTWLICSLESHENWYLASNNESTVASCCAEREPQVQEEIIILLHHRIFLYVLICFELQNVQFWHNVLLTLNRYRAICIYFSFILHFISPCITNCFYTHFVTCNSFFSNISIKYFLRYGYLCYRSHNYFTCRNHNLLIFHFCEKKMNVVFLRSLSNTTL